MRRFLLFVIAAVSLLLSGSPAGARTGKVRVMSFNVRVQLPADTGKFNWESRKEACVKALRKYKPDILGIQEAASVQKQYLMKELSKYYVMVDGSAKPGTLNEDTAVGYVPIFFRADRFELLDYGTFWLNEEQAPEKVGWDAERVRNVYWVKLRFRKSGQILFCFNTQLDRRGTVSRTEGSKVIVEKIKEMAGDKAVVFLTGDFNVSGDDASLKPLGAYLKKADKEVRKADTTPSFNDFGRSGAKSSVDHIFSRNAQARSFEVVSDRFGVRYVSDHYPLSADFEVEIPKD